MTQQIMLGDIQVQVVFKKIKNIHLKIYPPSGDVRITAPSRMSLQRVRVFANSKLDWIQKHRQRIQDQPRESPRQYLDQESHFVWGKSYLLKVVESSLPQTVKLQDGQMILQVRPGADMQKRRAIVETWYRQQLKEAVPKLIAKWEPLMKVKVKRFYVRRMTSKWGSCTPSRGSIRLNTDLAKKPPACLDYVVMHEMVHLLEASHNKRFYALMSHFMPDWKTYRDQLNQFSRNSGD